MGERATILLISHNRPEFLRRALEYYSDKTPLLVADSSTQPLEKESIPENVRYIHFPGTDYVSKLQQALESIETPYLQIVADDDFLDLDALEEACRFLDQNSDYGAVQGWHVGFQYVPPDDENETEEDRRFSLQRLFRRNHAKNNSKNATGSICASGMHEFAMDLQVEDSDPLVRVKRGINPYFNSFYSLQRTRIWESFFNELCPSFKAHGTLEHMHLFELGQGMNVFFSGKVRILKRVWIYREFLPCILSGANATPVKEMLESDDSRLEKFFDALEDQFGKGGSEELTRQAIRDAVSGFAFDYSPKWEEGSIPHHCNLDQMCNSSEDRAKLAEIEALVVRYGAQLEDVIKK